MFTNMLFYVHLSPNHNIEGKKNMFINDVKAMLLQSECQKCIFQQFGDLHFNNFSFDAQNGALYRDCELR